MVSASDNSTFVLVAIIDRQRLYSQDLGAAVIMTSAMRLSSIQQYITLNSSRSSSSRRSDSGNRSKSSSVVVYSNYANTFGPVRFFTSGNFLVSIMGSFFATGNRFLLRPVLFCDTARVPPLCDAARLPGQAEALWKQMTAKVRKQKSKRTFLSRGASSSSISVVRSFLGLRQQL